MNLGEVPRKGPPVWREWLNRSRIGGKIVGAFFKYKIMERCESG